MIFETNPNGEQVAVIFTPYITKKGKRIYHPQGGEYSELRSLHINIVINLKGCFIAAFFHISVNRSFLEFL